MKLKVISGIGLLLGVLFFSCQHGANGQGLLALMPPLNDSIYLKANKHILACYIKFGIKGKVTIGNKQFENAMPANDFAPIEIAEVLTYVTNSFGNKMGTITSEQAAADLKGCN